jgi:hypothetical protein
MKTHRRPIFATNAARHSQDPVQIAGQRIALVHGSVDSVVYLRLNKYKNLSPAIHCSELEGRSESAGRFVAVTEMAFSDNGAV